jgi:hypothetical protein
MIFGFKYTDIWNLVQDFPALLVSHIEKGIGRRIPHRKVNQIPGSYISLKQDQYSVSNL